MSCADQQMLILELAADEADNRRLGLAKAVARLCVKSCGVERSARAIEAVRDLTAGYPIRTSPGGSSNAKTSGHVIAAAHRR